MIDGKGENIYLLISFLLLSFPLFSFPLFFLLLLLFPFYFIFHLFYADGVS